MDELEQARREIDQVDAQLAALFERRMQAVMQVARYKKAHGLPIHDPAREELVLAKSAQRIQDPALRPYYLDHVRKPDGGGPPVRGPAAGGRTGWPTRGWRELLPISPCGTCSPMQRLSAAPHGTKCLQRCRRGTPPRVWCPLKTATPGMCRRCWTCATATPELWVVQVYDLPVRQNLLVVPGTTLPQIRHVYSHQQAIAPERDFPEADGPALYRCGQHRHGRQICGRERRPLQGRHRQPGNGRPLRPGSAGARHQHRRGQHHPVHRHQPGKAHRRQPLLPAVHGGQQAGQAGGGDPEDRRIRLQHGVHQEPPHAPCAL